MKIKELKNKGISPLLSSVLLIAIGVSIALIINAWSLQYVSEKLREVEEIYTATESCIKSGFKVERYEIVNNVLRAMLVNTGEYDLYEFKINYLKNYTIISENIDFILEKNSIKYLEKELFFYPQQIRIMARSKDCKLVYIDIYP